MAKLKGKAKEEFLKRMARGRAKSKRKNPAKKKKAKKAKRAVTKKKPAHAPKKNPRKKPIGKRAKTTRRKAAKATRKHAVKRNGRRRNGDDAAEAAAAMYEKFHQRPPAHIVEYEQAMQYPEAFAECGDLIELRFFLDEANPDFPLTQFKGTKVLCTVDGENLYFCKGDQSVDFQALDIAADKDMIELGPCSYICYHTTKGFHDFAPTKYFHEFGEENEILPTLCYDRLNKRLFLMGGDYKIKRAGIVN